jgi:hypothetical protein
MKTKIILRSFLGVLATAFMLAAAPAPATELIINGGLESGSSSWTLSGGVSASTYAGLAHSGTYYLWFGGAVNENDAGYQTITIPANATAATLSFYYNINSAEGTSAAYDTFSATIRNTSGTVLATVGNWSNINKDGGAGNPYYHQQTFNLLSYAGQTIRIYFSSVNDSSLVTNFRVDDVSVQVTVPTGSAPTVSTSPASLITTTTARMNGTVNPNGADTTVYFQWGLTTAYGNNTGSGDFGSGTTTQSAYSDFTGLTPNTTYHYQLVAYNSYGTRYGGDMPFTTLPVSCSYSLSSYSSSPGYSSGSSSFTVTTGSSCTWSAVSDSTAWLHTSSSGTGSGTVNYSYDANPNTTSRIGHITAGGPTFTVTQAGATFSTRHGVDYGFPPWPSAGGISVAGYDFVIRYVGGSVSKDITLSEAQAFQAAGLDIIIVFENATHQMQSGYNQGVSDAVTAVTEATAAGAPANLFCYFACDFDAQPSDQTAINAYLDGAASILGSSRVGFYGGYGPMSRVLDAGKASKGWQTAAWSSGAKDPRISLYQYAAEVIIDGVACDIDDGYGSDLGQWSGSPPPTVSIGSVSPNTSSVVAGSTFTIYAAVNSSQSRTVLLGASLVPAGTTSGYISDPPHDASATLSSGNNNVSRLFTVPVGTTTGTYDLLFAVWQDSNGDGQIDSGDTLLAGPTTIPNALAVTASYTITASAGTGGSIIPNGSFSKNAGDNQAFTATPSANYVVNQWLVDSGVVQNGGTGYTLYNIQAAHSVQVTFTYVPPQYTISASAGSGGSISPSGSFSKNAGDSQAFTATPSANYVVNQWLVDSGVVQNGGTGYTLNNIQAAHSVQVTFTYISPQYTINASAGTGGGISPNGSFLKNAEDNQAFTATPSISYIVNQWLVDSGVVQTGGTSYSLNNIQSSHNVQVTFTQASSPKINNPHRTGTTFTLSVPTQVGFNYTLEYKNAFSDANWTFVQTLSGTGGTITLTDTGATGSRRFYRIRVQ